MGNSHLPIGKIASVTTPIVFVIFGFYRSFAFPVNFSSMASGNFVIFVGFVFSLFRRGPSITSFVFFFYFLSMGRQNFVIFVIFAVFVTREQNLSFLNFVAEFHPGFILLLWPRAWALIRGRALITGHYWLLIVFGSLLCIFLNLK